MGLHTKWLALLACLLISKVAQSSPAVDPSDDTFGVGPDLIALDSTYDQSTLMFRFTFADLVSAPSASPESGAFGYIDVDADQTEATGATPFSNLFAPLPPVTLGAEFLLDLGSEASRAGLLCPGFILFIEWECFSGIYRQHHRSCRSAFTSQRRW